MQKKGFSMAVNECPAQSGRNKRMIAGLCGFVAVALGAFGAHAWRTKLLALSTAEIWTTASLYHLMHSAVLLCIALAWPQARWSFGLILAGIALFSGSLYICALTGLKPLAMAAPVGGTCLMAGWLVLAFATCRGSVKSGE